RRLGRRRVVSLRMSQRPCASPRPGTAPRPTAELNRRAGLVEEPSTPHPALPMTPSEALRPERYINLETFRKDGSGVKTPVWFVNVGDKLGVFSNGKAYKVKRLARDPRVRVAACDVRGKLIESS